MHRLIILIAATAAASLCACEGAALFPKPSQTPSGAQAQPGTTSSDSSDGSIANLEDGGTTVLPESDAGAGPQDSGTHTTPPDAGPPPCPASLVDRVTVVDVDVSPRTIDPGAPYLWSNNKPILVAPLPDGTQRIAFSADDQKIHVIKVDAAGAKQGTETTFAGDDARGLVAHGDGAFGLLYRSGEMMRIARVDGTGTLAWDLVLIGDQGETDQGDKWINGWGHEGRLTFDGTDYQAYFGHAMNWGPQGNHQGDMIAAIGTDGAIHGGDWGWGCSHSIDVRMIQDGPTHVPVCLSDCYPEKAILVNHYGKIRDEPTGNCAGTVNAQLGGVAAAGGGDYLLSFASAEGRMSQDIGVSRFNLNGQVSQTWWLTDAAGSEEAPHLARYGSGFLASWRKDGKIYLAELDATGAPATTPPVEIPASFEDRDDFMTLPNGDVVWAWADSGSSTLKRATVRACTPGH